MTPTPHFLSTTLALGALAAATPAQLETICSESFDTYTIGNTLQGESGGQYWYNAWWSDLNDTVVSGLNGTAGALQIGQPDSGAYRLPKTGPWTDTAAPGFKFGGDGTVLWISFWAQRNGDGEYAGVLLNQQFEGEKVFLGTPYQSGEWGIADSGGGSGHVTAPGSDIDAPTHLVYKVEYLSGQELVSLWVNPASAHPATGPDASMMVGDHAWNEVGIKAGTGGVSNWAFTFDEFVMECENCTPPTIQSDVGSISLSAGGAQQLTLSAGLGKDNYLYLLLGSLSGTSPGFPVPLVGTLPLNLDAYTTHTLANPNLPPLAGSFGALDLDGKAFPNFSLPAGTNPGLAGLQANHAAVAFNPLTAELVWISDAEPCDLLP